jgi:hypothetical protein
MDSRYKASPRVRDFADGPGVLPPVDAIAPVEDKGMSRSGSGRRRSTSIAPVVQPETPVKSRPAIRSSPNR